MSDIWREIVLKTLREKEWKDGKGFGLWIVQKAKNDTSVSVTVRAGMYYTDKVTGEKRYPKDGLTDWDLSALKDKWNEVKPLLDRKNPPPVPPLESETQAPPAQAPSDDSNLEEVPF